MFSPLKVTFEMDTPMVPPSGYPLHFDALVAYAITQKKLGEMTQGYEDVVPDTLLRELARDLPFEKAEGQGGWVWKASALMPVAVGDHAIRQWTRKTDPYDYAKRVVSGEMEISAAGEKALAQERPYALVIDTVRGLLKNQLQFYEVVDVRKMIAWCVGDKETIKELLSQESGLVTHLGKRSRIGHGRICNVTVEVDAEASLHWKQRILPWQESPQYVPLQAAFRPPYWAVENRAAVFCPPLL